MIKKLLIFFSLILFTSCAQPMGGAEDITDIQPNPQRPSDESVEGGLWFHFDKAEEFIKTSGMRLKDEKTEKYLMEIVCKLSSEYCKDIRIYIIKSPSMQASMAANGVMHVYTGLLARAKNEAEVATVIAHEMAHYIKRHSLKRQVDLQARYDANAVATLLYVGLEIYLVGSSGGYYNPEHVGDMVELMWLMTYSGQMAYSRFHESESDILGLEMMANAGYELSHAWKFWEFVISEAKELKEKYKYTHWSHSHPAPPERVENLKKRASELRQSPNAVSNEENYQKNISHQRGKWIKEQIGRKNFEISKLIIDRLDDLEFNISEIEYLKGEMYRAKRNDKDLEKAIEHYKKSIELNNKNFLSYRELGLIYYKRNMNEFKDYLKKYIEFNPNAKDKEMILSYLEE